MRERKDRLKEVESRGATLSQKNSSNQSEIMLGEWRISFVTFMQADTAEPVSNTGCNIISSDCKSEKGEMYVMVEDVHLLRVSIMNVDILEPISKINREKRCLDSLSVWLPGAIYQSILIGLGADQDLNS